jgi:hypothetical protein
MPVDRVIHLRPEHRISVVAVVIECSCGDVFEADTETEAIRDWEIHVSDEAHNGGHGTERPPT